MALPPALSDSPADNDASLPAHPAPRERRFPWVTAGMMVLLGAGSAIAVARLGWSGVQQELQDVNPVVAIAIMAVLPVVGFSIAIVYLLAGAKFGLWGGGVVILGLTAFHLLATHAVVRRFFREPAERYLQRHRKRIPEVPPGENASFAAMLALVPGIPYFARNYILALSHVPLRTYFWICLPIYTIRSYVTLSLGDVSADLSREKVLTLAAVFAVKLSICTYLLYRIRRRHRLLRAKAQALPPDGISGNAAHPNA